MDVIDLGPFRVALPADGTLRVRVGQYVVQVTPDPRTEPRIETTYLPKESKS